MKGLLRKGIVVMVMLAMLVQMTGSVFAAERSWTSDGKLYIVSVTTSSRNPQYVAFSNKSLYHTKGTESSILIEAGRTVTCNIDTVFPTTYEPYLILALSDEEVDTSESYTQDLNYTINIDANSSTGNYIAVMKFIGKSGTWVTRCASPAEAAPMVTNTGSFSFAPSSSTGKPIAILAS